MRIKYTGHRQFWAGVHVEAGVVFDCPGRLAAQLIAQKQAVPVGAVDDAPVAPVQHADPGLTTASLPPRRRRG